MNERYIGDLIILQHATCFELYKNYLPPETVDYMKIVRNQIGTSHAQHENMMGGRRDNYFMRNDDGPFFGRRRHRMIGGGGRVQREGVIFEINFPPNENPERVYGIDERQRHLELAEQFGDDYNASSSDSGKIHQNHLICTI